MKKYFARIKNMELNYINFENYLSNNIDLLKLKKIAVALSGGADSMCLTFLLNMLCNKYNIPFIAITIDHQLRKSSTPEAESVSNYLKRFSINHKILTWQHHNIISNIQDSARRARYNILFQYCKDNQINYLFVAHTYNDQAETILLRILRGSGIDGISGMNFCSVISNINIIRPLLIFEKKAIIKFLLKKNLMFFQDTSNYDMRFDRIKVRHFISQLDKSFQFTKRLNLLASNIKRTKNFVHSELIKVFKNYCSIGNLGFISIKYSDFFILAEEIQFRLINHIIKYIRNDITIYPIRLQSIKNVVFGLQTSRYQKYTLSKCQILLDRSIIYIYKEPVFIECPKKLSKGNNIWDDRYKIIINSYDFMISRLTKKLWSYARTKNYTHNIPSDILFSTPIVYSSSKKIYILQKKNIFCCKKYIFLRKNTI